MIYRKANTETQKYATLKFRTFAAANSFKQKVGSNHSVKEKVPGVFSIRFKIDKSRPLNINYHKNRIKYG